MAPVFDIALGYGLSNEIEYCHERLSKETNVNLFKLFTSQEVMY